MKLHRHGQAEALTKEDFRKVLEQIPSANHRLVFALCWFTAERPSAILQLRVEHVYGDPDRRIARDTILIPGSTRKDGKTREIPIASPELRRELRLYSCPSTGFLFPGATENHLTFSAYDKALRRVFLKMRMTGYSTYSTRRGALTVLSRSGFALRSIQSFSGHSSLASLQRYLEGDGDKRAMAEVL